MSQELTPEPYYVVPHVGVFCKPCNEKMDEEDSESGDCSRFVCPKCGNSTPFEELPQ